jgi:hypothetical protein
MHLLPESDKILTKDEAYSMFYNSTYIRQLLGTNVLIPGVGALGCELTKLFSMMKSNDKIDIGRLILCDFDSV